MTKNLDNVGVTALHCGLRFRTNRCAHTLGSPGCCSAVGSITDGCLGGKRTAEDRRTGQHHGIRILPGRDNRCGSLTTCNCEHHTHRMQPRPLRDPSDISKVFRTCIRKEAHDWNFRSCFYLRKMCFLILIRSATLLEDHFRHMDHFEEALHLRNSSITLQKHVQQFFERPDWRHGRMMQKDMVSPMSLML